MKKLYSTPIYTLRYLSVECVVRTSGNEPVGEQDGFALDQPWLDFNV